MRFSDLASKLTGISCPLFGVSWNPAETQRNIARRIVIFLEGRRVLYEAYGSEALCQCIESVTKIKEYLTSELPAIDDNSELSTYIRAMRKASNKFLKQMESECPALVQGDIIIDISTLLGLKNDLSNAVEYDVVDSEIKEGYEQQLIVYQNEGSKIPAFLLIPVNAKTCPAIIIHHQHNGQRHLGKSEVCGLAGNPLQAFGPQLAKRGFVVLCPDSICFEDRRSNAMGIYPLDNDGDFLQHYNEMCYRIIKGDTLMGTVISDAMAGITVLENLPYVDKEKIGTLGHSYGGNTVFFLMTIDKRIRYGCASGSACTFQNRMENSVGIEMASVIPHFYEKYDIDDLVKCIAPNKLLIVSADDDKYSIDADFIYQQAKPIYTNLNADDNLQHKRYQSGHALTGDRFDYIVNWLCDQKR